MIQRKELRIGRRVQGRTHGQSFTGEIRGLSFNGDRWHASVRIDGTVTSPAGRPYSRVGIASDGRNSTIDLVQEQPTVSNIQRITEQVVASIHDHPDYDYVAIVEEIGDKYGFDVASIDDIPSEEYWAIVESHDQTA